ncbi:MAG: hypothetical protein DRJ30_04265 [Candidatus Methanomethylicota archaeon]|nr:MAG: hypothetical protein DRJ30_04265 [Candidatus Verstraetearchaeota archaeon]
MVTELKTFKTVKELISYLDEQVENTKRLLEEYMSRLETQKSKMEKIRALSESLGKILGRAPSIGTSQTVDIMGLKLIINPSPIQEVTTLEDVIKQLNDKLIVLQKIKKAVESLGMLEETELNLNVAVVNDIPTVVMMQLS